MKYVKSNISVIWGDPMVHKNILAVIILSLLVWTTSSKALPFPSLDPAFYGPDLDGNGLFTVTNLQIDLESLDAPSQFGGSTTEFGFYNSADPSTLVTIFDVVDQNPDPGGPGNITPTALIYFDLGVVVDGDDGFGIQSIFTPKPVEIGYYIKLESGFAAALGIDEILYSQSSLNSGGIDYFAAFPLLFGGAVPEGSFAPTFFYFAPDAKPLYVAAAINVDEPPVLLMLAMGLAGLAFTRRRRILR